MAKRRRSKKNSFANVLWRIIKWIFITLARILSWIFRNLYLVLRSFLSKKRIDVKQKLKENKSKSARQKAKYESFPEVKSIKGSYSKFEEKIVNSPSTIGIILGARGTGKTALGMKLLENLAVKTKKEVYALGFKPSSLPDWITAVDNPEEIKNNAIALIDEGGITFGSRDSMSDINKFLSKVLLVARHKDLSVIFISQNSSNIDVNAIRQADYLLLKPSSLLQLDFERKKIKEIYLETMKDFEKYKDHKGLTYIYSDQFTGFITNPLPSFWSQKVSKAFENFSKEKK